MSENFKIEGLLRPDEVCNALQISTAKFYRLVVSGRLPAVKIGSTWRVKPSMLSKWIKEQTMRIGFKKQQPD
jgi:excisionase family DNA binding protein